MNAGRPGVAPTISGAGAAARLWDVAVVGAGPAGCAAAIRLAESGARVLLLDRLLFPRDKVCGCCVGVPALGLLGQLGLDAPAIAPRLRELDLRVGRRSRARLPLPGGVALSRAALDAALVERATECGAEFLPGATVERTYAMGDARGLDVGWNGETFAVRARLIVVAEGLGRRLCRAEPGVAPHARRDSWVGVAAMAESETADPAPGVIEMTSGPGGYVGMTRLEDGRLNIAGALDPRAVRSVGPGGACAAILERARVDAGVDLRGLAWRGVGTLTGAVARPAAHRMLVVGDAAGYVEPFTGEGIGWALASGMAAAPIASGALAHGWGPRHERAWAGFLRGALARRQLSCRALAAVLRRPLVASLAARAVGAAPFLARPILSTIHAPLPAPGAQPHGSTPHGRPLDRPRHGDAAGGLAG